MRPIPTIVPFYYASTGGEIQWPDEVTEELAGIRRQISQLRGEERTFLQRKARELGITAATLEELRSEKGNSYEPLERRGSSWRSLQTAVEQGVERFDAERAYLCTTKNSWLSDEDQKDYGCGWVRGIPRSETYDDLAGHALAGSAGNRHYCQICGMMLAEDRQIVS